MKKIVLILFILFGSLCPNIDLFASHGMGGEITWTCLPNGQFKFRMKFYRDCTGISASSSITLTTTVPGVPSIPMPRVQQNDISPTGIPAAGVGTCPTCANHGGAPGVVEEHVYESAPVTLNGVPPAAGWQFYWGECCRSNLLSNIANPGSIGFRNRAVMYPYNGRNTNPCFDSSPYFAEKPSTIICTGYPFKYNPNAIDPELDSLVSEWGQPLTDGGTNVNFSPGYNINSQLPSATQNPNNIAAAINPNTGEMTYLSYTGGYFATVVKVAAYKCGIKVAEIFREINVVLINNCPPVMGGAQNLPPVVAPPFIDQTTGLFTSYIDTVYAGDTVNFVLTAEDYNMFNNGVPQTITMEASGSQFGTNFSNTNAGCIIPPCATLSPASPTVQNPLFVQSFQIAGQTTFNWITTCAHVEGLDTNCRRVSNTYNFVIKASDNYCPANASNVSTISIVVLPAPPLDPPVLRCASVNTDGGVTLSWTRPTERDSQNTFYSYDVYASLAPGPWILVDSITTAYDLPATYTYTQSPASLNALFGTNAQLNSISYYLVTRSGCRGDSSSVPSNILHTIKLNAVLNGSNQAVLTWNPLSTPPLSSHALRYKIHREYPSGSGTWTLIDSTALLTYTDNFPTTLCSGTLRYRVSLADSTGCISWSSIEEIIVSNSNPIVIISPVDPAFCQGGSVTLTCNTPGLSYQWNNLQATQSITVSTTGTYTVTVTQAGGCTSTGTTTVTVNPNPIPVITGITEVCQGETTTFDAGPGPGYTYEWSGALGTGQTITTGTAGSYTVTVTDANLCTGTATVNLIVNPLPVPNITGIIEICQGNTTTLTATGVGINGYDWGGGITTQTHTVSTSGTYTVTVSNIAGCTATTSTTVTVNPLPLPIITGDLSFCQGSNTILDVGLGYNTYQWSGGLGANNTATVNTANTFTVTVTDFNGCSNSTSVTTIVNPNPVPVITGVTEICQGTTTIFDAGPGFTYEWAGGLGTGQSITTGIAGNYTVTITDANQCTGTATINLVVNQLPSATLSGIDTICFGQSTNINVVFGGPGPYHYTYFDGTVNQGPITTNQANINISVNPTVTTNYTLISISNDNCQGAVAGLATVEVTPLPSAVISGTTTLCNGDNTDLSISFTGVAPYTYSYTAGAQTFGPFTTNNNPEIINVSPGATITYGLTATVTGFGCSGATNPATVEVTVNDLPTATVSGNNTICAGSPTDLTFNFVGTGPYTYTYSNGTNNFGPFTTPNNPEIISVSPGATTIYNLISVNDDNCPGSVSGLVEIVVNPLPTADLTGTASICNGDNTNLSIAFTGTGPYTYSYNDGGSIYGPFTTNQNPVVINVSPVLNTSYGITTINDANCAGTGSGVANITVIPLPTSTLTGSTTICRGSSTNITLEFTGVPPFEYTYTDGINSFGPFNTNNTTITIPVSPNNNISYQITSITGAGCEGTPTGVVDIVVNDIPEAEAILSGNGVICNGEASEFTIEFAGTAPFTYTYTDGTNVFGPITTNNNPEIIPVNPSASTNYTLVNMSDNNCPGLTAGIAEITVNPLPVATVGANISICEGSGTSFTIGFTGTGPYTYMYSDGTVNYGPFTTNNNPEIIQVAPLVSTDYNVLTIYDANCTGSAVGVASVTVNQIPSAVITGDATICDGDVTDLNITFAGVGPFAYTYSNGTSILGPFTSATASTNIPVSPGTTTNYTLVAISDANCPGTISGNVDIIVNPLPEPAISGVLAVCDGESSTLTATPGFVSYTWTNGNTTNIIDVTLGGAYGVSVTDVNGCIGTTSVNFVVHQVPVISFTNDTSLTCDIPKVNFNNTSSYPSGSQFLWDFGDNSSSFQSNPSHIYDEPGTYTVTLTITSQFGCTSTASQSVDIMFYPLAEAKFIADPEVTNVFNGKVQFIDQSEHAVSWLWDFNDGGKSVEQNPYHYFNEIGEYTVTLMVTNITGCPDKYTREIVVNPFYIPNAFTPNADGINDYFFEAGYVLDVKSFKMIIFNRWGQRVFETSDYNNFWNGYDSNDKPAQDGVYVYTIEVVTKGGKEHKFKGTVTLVR